MRTKRSVSISFSFLVLALGLLSGCTSTHEGDIGWVDRAPQIDDPVEIQRTEAGTARGTYILGIIGPRDMHLFDRARRDLIAEADLEDGEYMVSRSMDVTTARFPPELDLGLVLNPLKLIPIYYRKTVHLSAEVVEPTESEQQ